MKKRIILSLLTNIAFMGWVVLYVPMFTVKEPINSIVLIFLHWGLISYCGILMPAIFIDSLDSKDDLKDSNWWNLFICFVCSIVPFLLLILIASIFVSHNEKISLYSAIKKFSDLVLPMIISYSVGMWIVVRKVKLDLTSKN